LLGHKGWGVTINWMLLTVLVLLTLRKRLLKAVGLDTRMAHGLYIVAMTGLLAIGYRYPSLFTFEGLIYQRRLAGTIEEAIGRILGSGVTAAGRFDIRKSVGQKFYERNYTVAVWLEKEGHRYLMAGRLRCTPVEGCRFLRGPLFLDERFVEQRKKGKTVIDDAGFVFESGYMTDRWCADYRVLAQLKQKMRKDGETVEEVRNIGGKMEADGGGDRVGYDYLQSCKATLRLSDGRLFDVRYEIFENMFAKVEVFLKSGGHKSAVTKNGVRSSYLTLRGLPTEKEE